MAKAKTQMILAINAAVPKGHEVSFVCPSTMIKVVTPKRVVQ